MRRPAAPLTCANLVMDDHDQWVRCGAPADGTTPDAPACCARCRAAANAIGAGLVAWLDEEFAAMDAAADEAASAA